MNTSIPFHGSYLPSDVHFLLKPIELDYTDVKDKEQLIQRGKKHYSEMLSEEYRPSEEYMQMFHTAIRLNLERLAQHVLILATELQHQNSLILVSLARAGSPVGVLLKRTLRDIFDRTIAHYSVSIIRDRGIDENALKHILKRHKTNGENIVFIDGWTGKGVIANELRRAVDNFNMRHKTHINPGLYVLADIAGYAEFASTQEDYLIPSSLLNATICGLISRSILNPEYIGPDDFHGCKFHQDKQEEDLSLWFVNEVMQAVWQLDPAKLEMPENFDRTARLKRQQLSRQFLKNVMSRFNVKDINLVKPGLGESIRVLLRRVPHCILVRDKTSPDIQPFLVLAEEKNVPIQVQTDMPYQAVGIISQQS